MSERIPIFQDLAIPEETVKKKTEKMKFGKLGISVEMAENRGNARDVKEYEDDFTVPTIEWLEGEYAMAFRENEPILIEGGTGIGKTRTLERMCARLGYELYKLPCSSSTTEREMMGRYVSNSERKSKLDPEVIFSLGVIAEALKEEPGKIKVIYLDEINAMDGAVGARLYDILDEAKNEKVKGRVKLVEDAGEVLEFDPKKVKIVATMNSADSKNTHAQKLSEALLRRFTYKRTVDELPDIEFLSIAMQKFQASDALKDLPGIEGGGELIKAYSECHKALQGLKRNNQIGVGAAQDFKFEDIDYLKRVIKKVSVFWEDGIFTNLPEAFREAVKIIYTGMIVDPTERKMMEEQIAKLDFKPAEDASRKGLADREKAKAAKKEAEEKAKLGAEGAKEKIEAEKMLEKSDKELASLKATLESKKKELGMESISSPEAILKIDRTADVIKFTGWSGAKIEDKDTDKKSIKLTEIDISKLKLDTSWLGGKSSLSGEERLKALKTSGNIRLDAQILIALRKLPKEELERKMEILAEANGLKLEDLKSKYIFFDGTIIRDSGGSRSALYLSWHGSEWYWNDDCLDGDWAGRNLSLVLAS